MTSWLDSQTLMKRYGIGAAILILPLLVNGFLWKSFTLPQQARLREWREKRLFIELKPKLEAVLGESRQLLIGWEKASFVREDPAAAIQAIQRLVGRHRVEIKEIRAEEDESLRQDAKQAQRATPGFSTMSLNLAVTGSFDRLARWISGVEAQPGLQINSWELESGEESNQPHSFTGDITVFLRGT